MISRLWRLIKSLFLAFGLLLCFFAVIELIRVYQTLNEVHPIAGYVFLIILGLILVWIIGYYLITMSSRPVVLIHPKIKDVDSPSKREMQRYGRYLVKYMSRLAENDIFDTDNKDKARVGVRELTSALKNGNNHYAIKSAIDKAEQEIINPLLDKLDDQTEKKVREATLDVMIAVAFCPYRSIDLLIVIYRNISMVTKIVRIYNSRPRLREQLSILKDVINVVVTVNYINLGSSILQRMSSKIPFIGKFLDDITQGIGAGFMTNVTGHAALYRCRAFRKYSSDEAKLRMRSKLKQFFKDIKDIFKKDLLPKFKKRIEEDKKPWKKIKSEIGTALDETDVNDFVRRPVATSDSSIMTASKTASQAVFKAGKAVASTFMRTGKRVLSKSKTASLKILSYTKTKLKRKKKPDK